MSNNLNTEVTEVENLEQEVETTTTLDEEDIAAQEALEKELADLGDDDSDPDQPEPIAAEDDTENVAGQDLEVAQKGMEAALNELHEFFNYIPPAQSTAQTKAAESAPVAEKQKSEVSASETKLKELEAEMERVKTQLAEEQKAKQQAAHAKEIYGKLQTFMEHSMNAARARYTDYDQATQYYLESRLAHFKALSDIYPNSTTDQGALNYVHGELGELIATCAKNKENPAEKLYDIAHKLGYKPSEEAVTQKKKSISKAATDNVRRIDFAQKATKTLTSTNGKTINEEDSDIPMSDEEYDIWIQEPENRMKIENRLRSSLYS